MSQQFSDLGYKQLAYALIALCLGIYILLFTKRSALVAGHELPTTSSKNPSKVGKQKKKKSSHARAPHSTEAMPLQPPHTPQPVVKGRGRTVPGLGMEADVVRLRTTADVAAEKAKRSQSVREKGTQEKLAERSSTRKHKKDKPPRLDARSAKAEFELEMQRKTQELSSRINTFVSQQGRIKPKESEAPGTSEPAIRVSSDLRRSSFTWNS